MVSLDTECFPRLVVLAHVDTAWFRVFPAAYGMSLRLGQAVAGRPAVRSSQSIDTLIVDGKGFIARIQLSPVRTTS